MHASTHAHNIPSTPRQTAWWLLGDAIVYSMTMLGAPFNLLWLLPGIVATFAITRELLPGAQSCFSARAKSGHKIPSLHVGVLMAMGSACVNHT